MRQDDLGARNRRRDLPGTWQIGGCQDDLGTQLSEPVTADNLLLTSYQVLVWIVPSIAPQPTEGEERGGGRAEDGAARPRALFGTCKQPQDLIRKSAAGDVYHDCVTGKQATLDRTRKGYTPTRKTPP